MSTHVARPHNESNLSPAIRKKDDENDEDGEGDVRPVKRRKCTSKILSGFKEATLENGKVNAECIHCCHGLSFDKSRSTTHSDGHLTNCFAKSALKKPTASKQKLEHDHTEIRELISHMVILHELPLDLAESKFFNSMMGSFAPECKGISSGRARKDCLASYHLEKEEVISDLYNVNRVSLNTELWKSGNEVSHMVVNCQYVDFESNLQKRILNVYKVHPPRYGLMLSDLLHKCLVEWGIEKKVWTVTVDNAACNDAAVGILREILLQKHKLPLNGKFFRVRCFAHLLNLMAQDGLSAINDTISKVRESVKYVAASETRIKTFSEIAKGLEINSSKLVLDRCMKWNTTYSMLSVALDFKDAFSRYQEQDPSYDVLPSEEEWEKVRVLCSFLEVFNGASHLQPGECLTSELVLVEFVVLKRNISRIDVGEDTCMINMVTKMKARMDEYWKDSYLLMCVAAVLDPRGKMEIIDYCFEDIYSSDEAVEHRNAVLETLRLLYNEYAEVHKANKATKVNKATKANKAKTKSCSNVGYTSSWRLFQEHLKSQPRKSELDKYLDEEGYVDEDIYAISWWRQNDHIYRYTILPKMAYDVLSIPMTTAVSESAFEAGSKVIDPHYASMGAERVQVLLCGGDWMRTRYEIPEKAKENVDIQEINLA